MPTKKRAPKPAKIRITDGPDLGRKPIAKAEVLKKPRTTKKPKRDPAKLIKSDAKFQQFAADLRYYRARLAETQEKLKAARNELSALEALEATYLNRLAEMQGHQ